MVNKAIFPAFRIAVTAVKNNTIEIMTKMA